MVQHKVSCTLSPPASQHSHRVQQHAQCFARTMLYSHWYLPCCAVCVSCRDISPSGLLFSPLLSYEGYSYADIVTTPLAEAMRDAINQAADKGILYIPPEATRPVVYMSLQGRSKLYSLHGGHAEFQRGVPW
jgi:hypothetical protein